MSYIKDEDLIKKIKVNNCSDSFKELIDRHSGIFFNMGKKYAQNCGLNLNDFNDNKYWIFYNAIQSFSSDKGSKFSTWLANQIRFFCLNFRNKNNKYVLTEDKVLELMINSNFNVKNNKSESLDLIKNLLEQISDENTRKAIYYRYFYDKNRILNYSEIANILKVTPQTVLNWHNKFIKLAQKKLTSQSSNDII
jgi:RNA polymerase sigma factor (sigma-70 family)